MIPANVVSQALRQKFFGGNTYMGNVNRRPNSGLNGGVTPTRRQMEARIQEDLGALRVKRDDDPYELQKLHPTGDEFKADSIIHIEAAAEKVLDMQAAHDRAVDEENRVHDDSGRIGANPDLPCKRLERTSGFTR